jgi:hypothetical protein
MISRAVADLRTLIILSALLLLLGSVSSAQAAVDLCGTGVQGNRVCTDVSGLCASAYYVPPFTDFFAGAGECPDASAGSAGVAACEETWAGYATLGGFTGLAGEACLLAYEDAQGRTCVSPSLDANLATLGPKPVCR